MSSLYKIRKRIQKWISKHSMHKPLYKANWHAPCSDEEDLQQKLNDLESWLIDRGYITEVVRLEIQKVNSIDRNVLLEKRPKHQEDSVTLILTFHSALHVIFDILKSAHGHIEKSPLLKSVLPKLSRVAFRNPKSLHYKLIWSKLKSEDEKERGNFPCCRKNCDICNILYPSNKFRSTVTGEEYKMNFHFNCNSICVVYLLTCKICAKQYTGSTITKFRSRFNQYKSNIKLYGEGRSTWKTNWIFLYSESSRYAWRHDYPNNKSMWSKRSRKARKCLDSQIKNTLPRRFKSKTNYLIRS